jgi:YVTN family beta-propeller protein
VRKIILSAMAAVLAATPLNAQSKVAAKLDRLTIARVSLPGEGRGDFLLADPASNRLFVTHSQRVHVLDLKTLKPVAEVTGLTVAHGVALDRSGHAYVTDGNSNSVVVFDPASGRELKRIAVGSKPDAILFDPASSKILIFNADSDNVSIVDPASGSVVGAIKLPNGPEYPQTDGRGHVYLTLEEGNSVAVIDTMKMSLDHVIPLTTCDGPAPLAFDASTSRLFAGCGNKVMVVIDAQSGKVVASVPIGGNPDGIVYDQGTKRIFVANRDGGWTIVRQSSADNYTVERTLKVDEYAKTLALDPATHRVFSSTADLVWPAPEPGKERLPSAKPGTFHLVVVSQL